MTPSMVLHNLRQKLIRQRFESGCWHVQLFLLQQQRQQQLQLNTSLLSRSVSTTTASFTRPTQPPTSTSTSSSSSSSSSSSPSSSPTIWTQQDDKDLSLFRRKKLDIAQILIQMPHQPLNVIESKLAEYDQVTRQKPTFQRWTPQEDKVLMEAVKKLGTKGHWKEISDVYFSLSSSPLSSSSSSAQEQEQEQGAKDKEQQQHQLKVGLSRKIRRSPRSCQIRWNFLNADMASNDFSLLNVNVSQPTRRLAEEDTTTQGGEGRGGGGGGGGFNQGAWSAEEIELFQELVTMDDHSKATNDWESISQAMGTRSSRQCHSYFRTVMHSGTKGKWTTEEIERLKEALTKYGRDWQLVSQYVGTRAPSQVRQKSNQIEKQKQV